MKDNFGTITVHTEVVNPFKHKARCPVCKKMFYEHHQIKPGLPCSKKCMDTLPDNQADYYNSL